MSDNYQVKDDSSLKDQHSFSRPTRKIRTKFRNVGRSRQADELAQEEKVFLLKEGCSFPKRVSASSSGGDLYHHVRRLESPVGIHEPFDVQQSIEQVQERFPYARDAIRALASADLTRTLFGRSHSFQPLLLVGRPGCGKSTLARVYNKILGYPCMTMNVGAMSDVLSFTGTHSTYSNPRPSVIVEYVAQAEVANPCVILDEIDKSPDGNRNGSVKDALLQFLEPGEAATFHDVCLNTEVNLSRVRWILTANFLEKVPAPLRSRCHVVHVPCPQKSHVPQMARQMVANFMASINMDARWVRLDGVEEAVLQENFNGDLRHLRMMVEILIRERMASLAIC